VVAENHKKEWSMSTAVEVTVQAISAVVQTVPIGTNLALVHILWVMMSGAFLPGRGAFFTAFDAKGFDKQVVRRSWAALRHGAWTSNELLDNWQIYVASENHWRVRRHERYQAVSVDMTGFWRPHLKGWAGKHFHHAWHHLVLAQTHVSADAATFSIYAYPDPLYKHALVLATDLGKIKVETPYPI
jgi:hypothetical protein